MFAASVVAVAGAAVPVDRTVGTESARLASAPDPGVVRELAGLRTASSRSFLKADGSLVAQVFAAPVTRGAAQDCTFSSDNTEDCTSTTLTAGARFIPPLGETIEWRSLLRFDLAGAVPADAEVIDARLALRMVAKFSSTASSFSAYPVTAPWTTPGVGWWAGTGPAADTISVGGSGAVFYRWNVTQLTRAWVAGTAVNHGVVVRDPEGVGFTQTSFASSEATDPGQRPYLEITYGSRNADLPGRWATAPAGGDVRFGDVNGDGAADLVSRDSGGQLRVGLSVGRTFAPLAVWGSWPTGRQFELADVDGDDRSDVVGRDASSQIVHLALSSGSAFATAVPTVSWTAGYSLAFTDADGDGLADLAGRDATTGDVRVAYSAGTSFEPPTSWATLAGAHDVLFFDIDGDGGSDLVARSRSDGAVRLGFSNGSAFDTATTFATVSPSLQLRVEDADGDDQGDLIYRDQSSGEVFVRRFDGSTFTSAGYWGSWDPQRSFDTADADGDERADIVGWYPTSGDVYVSLTTVAIPDGPPVQAYTADPDVVYDDEDIVASSAASGGQALAVPPSPIPRLAFQDDGVLVDRRGLSAIRAEADQQIQRLYDRIIEVGATVVRFNVIWGQTENADGSFIWQRTSEWALDRAVAEARSRGLYVHLTITGINRTWDCNRSVNPDGRACPHHPDGTPDLTTAVRLSDVTGNDPDPVQYRRFVSAVVDHFTHNPDGSLNVRVAAYSLWNEPNLKVFLREAESGVVPAAKYRRLYLEGRAGAQSAYSGARVFIGELSELAATGRMPGSLLGDRRQRVTAMDFLQEVVRPRSDTSPSVETEGVTLHAYQHRGAAHSAGKRLQVGIGKLNGDLIDPRDQRRGRENLTGVNRTLNLLYRRRGPSGSTSSTATGVRWLRTPGGRRPSLYVTEFGYFNKPLRSSDLAPTAPGSRKNYWHTEHARALKLRGQSAARPGALEVIRESRAKWALLYHLVEYPGQLDAKTGQPVPAGKIPWDSGLVGTPPIVTNPDGSRTVGPAPVTGTRSYGKDPSGRDLTRLDFPQAREAYCAVWRWASSPPGDYGNSFPGYYDTRSNACGTRSP